MKRGKKLVFWLAAGIVALVVGGVVISMYVTSLARNAGQVAGEAGGSAAAKGVIGGFASAIGIPGLVTQVETTVTGSTTYRAASSWVGQAAESWDRWWASWFDPAGGS